MTLPWRLGRFLGWNQATKALPSGPRRPCLPRRPRYPPPTQMLEHLMTTETGVMRGTMTSQVCCRKVSPLTTTATGVTRRMTMPSQVWCQTVIVFEFDQNMHTRVHVRAYLLTHTHTLAHQARVMMTNVRDPTKSYPSVSDDATLTMSNCQWCEQHNVCCHE